MSKTNTFENEWLLLAFNNTNIALVGDATGLRGSTTAGSWYLALHSADPGEAGTAQTGSEVAYTGYARAAIARSSGGFTVSGNQVSNAALVSLGLCTAGTDTARFWSLGTASSGAGSIKYKGPLAASSTAKIFTATTADTLTVPGTALVVNDEVVCYAVNGATLPTGITEGTVYFVKTVSSNDITLSATSGGATLDITAAGAGLIVKLSKLAISTNVEPQFAIGTLIVIED